MGFGNAIDDVCDTSHFSSFHGNRQMALVDFGQPDDGGGGNLPARISRNEHIAVHSFDLQFHFHAFRIDRRASF